MEDMLSETKNAALADLLRGHKGADVSVLDLRGTCNWTDFFIIATVSSRTHMDGLDRHIKLYCRENEIEISGSSGKKNGHRGQGAAGSAADDEWRLIDLGSTVIHLMTSSAREFYDLERLWARIPK